MDKESDKESLNEIGKVYERPWGTYKTLDIGNGYQVKIIEVKPGGRLSLQRHFKRAEHWVVVKGKPMVTVGDKAEQLVVNQGVFIPVTTVHRLENFTDKPAAIIEVQVGSYLGEDDIERLEDVYNR